MNFPQDRRFDNSLPLLSEGYTFIQRRCRHLDSDAFQTRLLLRPVLCASGEDAARLFYSADHFQRKGALPPNTVMSLQDWHSVQLREGDDHAQRKQLFMSFMTPDSIGRLRQLMREEWLREFSERSATEQIVLHDAAQRILCRTACRWVGLEISDEVNAARSREFAAMIEGAGKIGPKNWRGLLLRQRTEKWARQQISDYRSGRLKLAADMPLALLADYEENGNTLDEKTAGVELLNLLRPTVAVGRYIVFAALALHTYPRCRQPIANGDEEYLHNFVQEVRRFYPFFPFVGGRAMKDLKWQDEKIPQGSWVLLDLYGTNHDPREWQNPEEFEPERFRDWNGSPFNFIPQGGGEFKNSHRCPGERNTIELIKEATRLLVQQMSYRVPSQDLDIDMSQMPALPASGFIISQVQMPDQQS